MFGLLALIFLLVLLLAVLEGILGSIVSVIIGIIIVIYVVRNFSDILDFILAVLPIVICGGIAAGILYFLISLAY